MQPKTHTLIAEIIYKIISNNCTGIYLNYKSFKYGCIKPDFVPKPIKVPHYKGKSFAYIMEKIEEIQREFILDSDKKIRKFSTRLGIITHYLADYFCLAHNDPQYNFFPLHFSYEKKLAQGFSQFSTANLETIQNKCFSTLRENNVTAQNWLKDYINHKHREYTDCPGKLYRDTVYSLEVCITAVMVILQKCILNMESAAA